MKNVPERIYLQLGEEVSIHDDCDWRELVGVSHCEDKIFATDIEYVRKDLAMSFAIWFNRYIKDYKGEPKSICVDDLFEEFLTNRNK